MNITPVNYRVYIDKLLSIDNRLVFVKTLERALTEYQSLWFTEIGDIYLENYGVDCVLPACKPERQRDHNYVVVIYNRYE